MVNHQKQSLKKAKEDNENFFSGFYNQLRLIFRLIKDRRVNILLKVLPIAALVYLVVPLDFLPVNPIDDAVVLWLGGYLFIELCPAYIVEEHKLYLQKSISSDVKAEESPPDVVEGTYRDTDTKPD